MNKIAICYFRSLYSQSACSLSVSKVSDYLLNRGYETNLFLLKQDDHISLISKCHKIIENDIIIYKTNYKDFEYGIRLFENLCREYNKKIYLTGPFAIMNKERIIKKYTFVTDVIDIQNSVALRNLVDKDILFVSESGIKTKEDIDVLKENGTNAVLIGETLMRSPDKKKALEELNGGRL